MPKLHTAAEMAAIAGWYKIISDMLTAVPTSNANGLSDRETEAAKISAKTAKTTSSSKLNLASIEAIALKPKRMIARPVPLTARR